MKILHVAETVIGGIASHLEEIVDGQVARFGVDSVLLLVPEDQVGEVARLAPYLRTFRPAPSRALSAARLARAAAAEARHFRPDIVHAHSTFAGFGIRAMPRRAFGKARIVYCPHGWSFAMDTGGLKRGTYAFVERALSRRCDAIINVSDHERRLALAHGLPDDRLHVALNGIAATAAAAEQASKGPLRLLFVGRGNRAKGVDILLAALERLDGGDRVIDIVGVRPDEVSDTAGADRATLHGWVPRDQVQSYLARCDALVMPSRWEGLPLAALEAMRAGRAVIASDCCSFGEVVEHGVTGLLFPTGDADALAATLRSVTREQLAEMGRAGRARFLDKFTADAQEERIADIYRSLR